MTALHVMNVPEDDALLPSWLEAQIAGPNLGELVAELEALRSSDTLGKRPDATLDALLQNRLREVSDRGLAGIPANVLRRLCRRPDLLVELQSHILSEGTSFWDQKLAESAGLSERVEAGWSRLEKSLGAIAGRHSDGGIVQSRRSTNTGRPVRWFVAGLATAAAIAVAVVVLRDRMPGGQQVASTGWGWNRADAFSSNVSREQYLSSLAAGAEEWRRKRPETPQQLAQRISEFREGCSRLILAEHKPLPAADRKWLVERCRVWAKKLDDHLADVEAGKDVAAVRGQVDETVNKLVLALRTRAAEPAPS